MCVAWYEKPSKEEANWKKPGKRTPRSYANAQATENKAKMKCEKTQNCYETLTKNSAKWRTSRREKTTKQHGASDPLVHLHRTPQDQGRYRHGKRYKQHVINQPANPRLAERFHIFKFIDVNKMAPDSGRCYSVAVLLHHYNQPANPSQAGRFHIWILRKSAHFRNVTQSYTRACS